MKNKYILFLLFIAASIGAQAQNVGVGVAIPNDLFHVSGTAAQGILFNNATTGTAITNGLRITINGTKDVLFNQQEAAQMQFFTSNAVRMYIDATGHVSINAAPVVTNQFYVQGSNLAGTIASVNVNSAINSAGIVGVGNTGVSTLPGATAYGVMGDVGIGNTNVGVAGYLGTPVNMPAAQAAGVFGVANNLSSGVGVYGMAVTAKVNVAGYFSSGLGITSNVGIQSVVTGGGSGANIGYQSTLTGATGTSYGFNSAVSSTSLNNYGVYSVVNGAAGAAGSTNTAGYFAASGAVGAGSTNYGINIAAGDLISNKLSGGASVNVAGLNPYSLMVADATGLVGKIITSFPPPGNTLELWMRPTGAHYIQPVSNANIQVYDNIAGSPQPYGIYYNGSSNDLGGYFVTTAIPAGYVFTAGVEAFSNIVGGSSTAFLTYQSSIPIPGLGTLALNGAGIYANTPDPGRPAALFATNTNCNYASQISYSNVWIGGYNYIDNSSATFNPPALYAQLNVTNAGLVARESGATFIQNRATTAGNPGFSIGSISQMLSSNQEGWGVEGDAFTNQGAAVGTYDFGGSFSGNTYSGVNTGGFAYVGGLFSGATYKITGGGAVAEVIPTADHGRITLDAPECPDQFYQDYGTVQLINGKAHVDLDPILAEIIVVNADNPLRVITQCNIAAAYGVAVVDKTATGFDLVELANGTHSGEVDYEIIAKTKTNNGKGRFSQGVAPPGAPKLEDTPTARTANQNTSIWNWPSDEQVYNYHVDRKAKESPKKPEKNGGGGGEGGQVPHQ